MPSEILAPESASATLPPPTVVRRAEHTVEIVSDSGEGAQKCGQIFGAVSAKMGNGVWTVEIIPAEIQPPPRIPDGASGYRIRIGSGPVTNWGDETTSSSRSTSKCCSHAIASVRWLATPECLTTRRWTVPS
jgi:hypothetical protein